jgi:methylenetetrahydrofolate dehydrogenase (NADP+)/methenyltetrahydrofolate cyclohydrolase
MLIDGKEISNSILEQLQKEVALLSFKPKLIDVVVGEDPVTEQYVNIKQKRAEEIGIDFEIVRYPEDVSQQELEDGVTSLNGKENLCGLIVQMPLPEHIDKQKVLDKIDPKIDVDVSTSTNLGRLFTGKETFPPATASAILQILDYHKIDLEGKNILVVGAGDLVGKPVAFLLIQRQATVTVANASTKNLKELCLQAEIIISGTGQADLIKGDMVKDGAVIIDAGTAESGTGITGDVEQGSVEGKASLLTPVPGGVGPVTVAMLLHNVVSSAKRR